MKRMFTWKWALATMACLGLLAGQVPAGAFTPSEPTQPNQSAPSPQAISDVALDTQGRLSGQVVDEQGQPRTGVVVELRQGSRLAAQAVTDHRGQFSVTGLSGGLYLLTTGSTQQLFRVWTTAAAPPQTRTAIVLVSETRPVVRGNDVIETIDEIDMITLTMVGTSIASLTVALVSLDEIRDLEDQVDSLVGGGGGAPASP